MALSLQNLFCSGSEDFDDEEFLSALESSEPSFSANTHATPVRLRPISAKDTQATGSSVLAKSGEMVSLRMATDPAHMPSLDQDVDDEELLSVCSEVEAGATQEQYWAPGQTSNPRLCLRPINPASQNYSCTSNPSSVQPRPLLGGLCSNAEPQTFLRHLQRTGPMQSQSCGFNASSPTSSNFQGRGHCQSPSPTAKRQCLRPNLEMQAVTPARVGTHSTYQRCITPTAGQAQSWQGATGSHTLPKTPQMPSRPHQTGTLQTPVVTNHLVQLVEAANKTPRVLAWETPPPKERKFPGPAGLLPQQGSGRRLDEILISTPHTPSHGARARQRSKENASSQQAGSEEFVQGPWAAMKAELALDENDPACFLRTYSVVMVLRKAALKQLPKNKVPRMAVALKSLTPANGDASAVFRDATGEIQGTVHHLLLEERESELKAGNVLLLQQVGVFSPSHRNHYLNVTPSNLVKIYPQGEGRESSTVSVDLMADRDVDVNSNDTQLQQRLLQCRPLEQAQSLITISSDINQPAPSPFLTSTALCRAQQQSFSRTESPGSAVSSSSYRSMQSEPGPTAHRHASCIVQAKATTPSFSTSQSRTSPGTDHADWDMDDLDSLLCDLPDDPRD